MVASLSDRVRDVRDFHHPCPEGSSTEGTEAPERGTAHCQPRRVRMGKTTDTQLQGHDTSAVFCIAQIRSSVQASPNSQPQRVRQDISKSSRPWKISGKREERGPVICNGWLCCAHFWGLSCMCDCTADTKTRVCKAALLLDMRALAYCKIFSLLLTRHFLIAPPRLAQGRGHVQETGISKGRSKGKTMSAKPESKGSVTCCRLEQGNNAEGGEGISLSPSLPSSPSPAGSGAPDPT